MNISIQPGVLDQTGDGSYLINKVIVTLASEVEWFFSLKLTDEDQQNIRDLIKDLDDKSYFQLFLAKQEMDQKAMKVRTIHPLRFIGEILSKQDLRERLKSIMTYSIKRKEFIDGFVGNMKEHAKKQDLLIYAEGFASLLKVPVDRVKSIISHESYSQIISEFI
jgi:hypothetical protein